MGIEYPLTNKVKPGDDLTVREPPMLTSPECDVVLSKEERVAE